MKKGTVLLTLAALLMATCIVSLVIDDWFSAPFGCALILLGYALSLCDGDKQITLPTQNMDEACKIMSEKKGRWHLVAVAGHCVVAYRNDRKAMDAMNGNDAVGYAVMDN